MKTQLTTLWKKRGLYRDTAGAPKERVQMLFPRKPQIENKNKTHKAQQQVPKTKQNKETPTCHLEAQINLVEGSNGVNCLGICFSLSASTSWNSLQEPLTTITWKESFISGSTHSPSPRLAKVFQTSGLSESFSLQWFSPAPKFTSEYTDLYHTPGQDKKSTTTHSLLSTSLS